MTCTIYILAPDIKVNVGKKENKKTIILKQVRRVYRRISIEYFLWETEDIRFN